MAKLSQRNKMINCARCGKRTHSNAQNMGLNMCGKCIDEMQTENAHEDGEHDSVRHGDCTLCQAAGEGK